MSVELTDSSAKSPTPPLVDPSGSSPSPFVPVGLTPLPIDGAGTAGSEETTGRNAGSQDRSRSSVEVGGNESTWSGYGKTSAGRANSGARRETGSGGGGRPDDMNTEPDVKIEQPPAEKDKGCCRRIVHSFTQQKLRAWQPVLTPRWVMVVFFVIGVVFLGFGIALLLTTNSIIECKARYSDPPCADPAPSVGPINEQCTSDLNLTLDSTNCRAVGDNVWLQPPLFLYYELNNFYQNHRTYVMSRNDRQLAGAVMTADQLSSCKPKITDDEDKVLSPCGLIAWTMFTDSYKLVDATGENVRLYDDADTIAWSTDVDKKFKNPDESEDLSNVNQWIDKDIWPGQVENGHFIVWMRNAALPDFRKLYAKIDSEVKLPITVMIKNRHQVEIASARKYVVLTSTSWVGGRNPFFGIAYTVVGSLCLLLGIFFFIRNWRKPRILGDVRYLNWVGGGRPS